MAFQLTLEAAVAAAEEAFAEGLLAFQSADHLGAGCHYRYPDGRRCAIGAALPDEVVEGLNNMDVGALVGEGRVRTPDLGALVELQGIHDGILINSPTVEEAAKEWRAQIEEFKREFVGA